MRLSGAEILRLSILVIVPLVQIAMAGVFMVLEGGHEESLRLTRQTVQAIERKASTLNSEMEKSAYISYLSNSIVWIRKESEEYAEGLFSLYRPTAYCLLSLAVLQFVVIARYEMVRRKHRL